MNVGRCLPHMWGFWVGRCIRWSSRQCSPAVSRPAVTCRSMIFGKLVFSTLAPHVVSLANHAGVCPSKSIRGYSTTGFGWPDPMPVSKGIRWSSRQRSPAVSRPTRFKKRKIYWNSWSRYVPLRAFGTTRPTESRCGARPLPTHKWASPKYDTEI